MLKTYLIQNGCPVLSGWLDTHPTASSMREVGLLTLRDILHDKPPVCIRDTFAAILVQHCISKIVSGIDHTGYIFFEWSTDIFSKEEQERLRPVYEYVSSGYIPDKCQEVYIPPKELSKFDTSVYLGTGAQFNDQTLSFAPGEFTQELGQTTPPPHISPLIYGMTMFGDPNPSIGTLYSCQLPIAYKNTSTNNHIPFCPPTSMSLGHSPSPLITSDSSAQLASHSQMHIPPNSPILGPESYNIQSDSLCTKLKKSRSWATLMTYLAGENSTNYSTNP